MLVNFDRNIKALDGTDLVERDQQSGELKPVPMKDLIVGALLANNPGETLSGIDKFHRGKLAEKVFAGGDIELPIEDVTKIKDVIGSYCTPLVVFQIFDYIEGYKLAANSPA
ncbi:MAG: hypothetical protein ACRD4H_05285 [Candidatus Acidiferrales bacterium]